MMFRILRSSRGNALMMVLATVAFVAVITVEIYNRADVTAKRSQQTVFKDETAVVMEALASNLQNAESCSLMLFQQTLSPGTESDVTLKYIYDPKLSATATTIQADSEISTGMKVELIKVATGAPDMQAKIAENPSILRRYPASLRFVFRSNDDKVRVNWRERAGNIDLGLKFYLWLDSSNRVVSCHGINSAATFCNNAHGYYHVENPNNPPTLGHDLRCRQVVHMDFGAPPALSTGFGTCRYNGVTAPGTCNPARFSPAAGFSFRVNQGDCFTGVCLPASDMCLQCE